MSCSINTFFLEQLACHMRHGIDNSLSSKTKRRLAKIFYLLYLFPIQTSKHWNNLLFIYYLTLFRGAISFFTAFLLRRKIDFSTKKRSFRFKKSERCQVAKGNSEGRPDSCAKGEVPDSQTKRVKEREKQRTR